MDESLQVFVSVVIPTRNRSHLILRAVKSALTQTFNLIEVIVVVDGPDENTVRALHQIDDSRLRIVTLPESVGGAGARNVGVNQAQGSWIAFLDDDDEWLTQKIEKQIEVANRSRYTFPVVSSRLIARTLKGDFIWPRRLPSAAGAISEYLFARNSLFKGEAVIQTSTLLTKRELLVQHPFKKELLKHQDTEWILRVSNLKNVKIEFVDEPLTIWNTEEERTTVSSKNNWQYSLAWIQENKHLVTPRAYASFILTQVSPEASQQGDFQAFWHLLQEAVRFGKPKPIDFLLHMGMWVIPRQKRRWLRVFLSKR
jgi:glycosyltransferase involved in cell wall biosynthesis